MSTRYSTSLVAFIQRLVTGEPGLRWEGDLPLAALPIRRLPPGLHVTGDLDLRQCSRLREIGPGLRVEGSLFIGGRLPPESHPGIKEPPPAPWTRYCTVPECPVPGLPENVFVGGDLVLTRCHDLTALPETLHVAGAMHLKGLRGLRSLPVMAVPPAFLWLVGSPLLTALPEGFKPPHRLWLDGVGLKDWPAGMTWQAGSELSLLRCPQLACLPPLPLDEHRLAALRIRLCPALQMPEIIEVQAKLNLQRLDLAELRTRISARKLLIRQCRHLALIDCQIRNVEHLEIDDCPALHIVTLKADPLSHCKITRNPLLTALPEGLVLKSFYDGAWLNLVGCGSLKALPAALQLQATVKDREPLLNIEIADTAVASVPPYPFEVLVRWRRVSIGAESFFHPEEMTTAQLLLTVGNAEVRRVMVEHLGIQRFLATHPHEVVDEDTDAGGPRRLLLFLIGPDNRAIPPAAPTPPRGVFSRLFIPEATTTPPVAHRVRVLHCRCPSTAREYLLPVPPTERSCRSAAPWLAGFSNPDDYAPIKET